MPLQHTLRPDTIENFIGNEDVLNVLESKLDSKSMPHAFLITGITGGGKTTLGRIIAKQLGVTGIDYTEIDSAQFRGIDTIRDLRSTYTYSPTNSPFRVFLIDECFYEDTFVKTKKGKTEIKNVKEGDFVYGLYGYQKVKKVFINKVPVNLLAKLSLNDGTKIYCSKNHRFLTRDGWVRCDLLKNNDLLLRNCCYTMEDISTQHFLEANYENKFVPNLWKRICIKKINTNNLFKELCNKIKAYKKWGIGRNGRTALLLLWEKLFNTKKKIKFEEVLLDSVQSERSTTKIEGKVIKTKKGIYMPILQKRVYSKGLEKKSGNLFKELCNKITKFEKRIRKNCREMLCLLWGKVFCKREQDQKVLFSQLCNEAHIKSTEIQKNIIIAREKRKIKVICKKVLFKWIKKITASTRKFFKKNETKQSYEYAFSSGENAFNERNEWITSYMEGAAGGKWKANEPTKNFSIGIKMGNGTAGFFRKTNKWFSNLLQSGCGKSKIESSDRNRWEDSFPEKDEIERRKKRGHVKEIGVDSVEIYKRSNRQQSFRSVVSDKEDCEGFINLYDLEMEGHPSYYVNDILAHNCHRQTPEAQDAMLKMLEDTPDHVIFILCTSEPQKLIAPLKRRCCILELQPLSSDKILNYLKLVVRKLKKNIPDDFLRTISESSEGSIGRALSYLDNIIDLQEKEINENCIIVEKEKEQVIQLCRLLMKRGVKWKEVMGVWNNIEDEPERVRRAVMGYCDSILRKADNAQAALILNLFVDCRTYDAGRPAITNTLYQLYDTLNG